MEIFQIVLMVIGAIALVCIIVANHDNNTLYHDMIQYGIIFVGERRKRPLKRKTYGNRKSNQM